MSGIDLTGGSTTTVAGTVSTTNTVLDSAIGVPKSSDVVHISLPNQTPVVQLLSASSTYRITCDVDITYCLHIGAPAEADAYKIPLWEKYIEVFNTDSSFVYLSIYNATTSSGNAVVNKQSSPV